MTDTDTDTGTGTETHTDNGYDPASLPPHVLAYLDAHDGKQPAADLFALDATVIDDGRVYRGAGEIGDWITRTAGEYEYTSTRIGQRVDDDSHATVVVRLDGNFPGGTVTLRYRFEHRGGLITRLTIGV